MSILLTTRRNGDIVITTIHEHHDQADGTSVTVRIPHEDVPEITRLLLERSDLARDEAWTVFERAGLVTPE